MEVVQFTAPGAIIWIQKSEFTVDPILLQHNLDVVFQCHRPRWRIGSPFIEDVDAEVHELFHSLIRS